MASIDRDNEIVSGHWSDGPVRPLGAIVLWVTAIALTAVGAMLLLGADCASSQPSLIDPADPARSREFVRKRSLPRRRKRT